MSQEPVIEPQKKFSIMKHNILSYLVQLILNIAFKTSKFNVHGEQHLKDSIASDSPTMVCVWHSRFLYSVYFLQDNNYDIWALLFDDYRHNCWGFYDKSPIVVNIMTNVIVDKLKNLKSNSLEVLSAFNGFGIYKTDRFKGFYYDGLYCSGKNHLKDK